MANPEHVALLKQGVDVWNKWRNDHPEIIPDLSDAFLKGANLPMINLKNADLTGANLNEAHCWIANFSKANLCDAGLSEADLFYADLSGANLKGANLLNADLHNAQLRGACFQMADLSETNLSEANMTGCNLKEADLIAAQARGTNFTGAQLTGACLEDWNINSATILDEVDCRYVYLKADEQERFPHIGEFSLGEFAKRFQVARNIIELAFYNGVPWKAFAYAFNESNIQVLDEYGDELFLREYKILGDGLVTLKVSFPEGANGDEIRRGLEQKTHELQIQIARLEGEIRAKDLDYEKLLARLFETPRSLVGYQINVNKVQIGAGNTMSGDRNIHTGGGSYYESINTGGGDYIQGDYINMSQDLTQVAAQIQELVEQQQKSGVTVDVAKQQVVNDLATKAKSDPTVREKLSKWVQDAAGKAVVTAVVKEVLKGAATSVGIPWP